MVCFIGSLRHAMIRNLKIFTGVILTALTVTTSMAGATAPTTKQDLSWLKKVSPLVLTTPPATALPVARDISVPTKTEITPTPEPVQYTVAAGDNLTKIAADRGISWLRIWNANNSLTNPDLIYPGQVFLIPDAGAQLTDRAVPAAVVAQMAPAAATRGPVAGNGYDAGYCTWYVKNRRPDLPNNLGNANTWYSQAAAQGFAVGSTPQAGAVGTTTRGAEGHVVFVESVNADGSIMVSEMNYAGPFSFRTRPAAASEFSYIY